MRKRSQDELRQVDCWCRTAHSPRWGAVLAGTALLALLAAAALQAQGLIRVARIPLLHATVLSGGSAANQGGAVKPQIVERDAFTVIGIEVRTNNSQAATVIPRQWQSFFQDGTPGKIPARADADFVVVYSGYASDHHGDYDYLIGGRVKGGTAAPQGMVVKLVPKARYAVVTTERGPVGKVVSAAWQKIWSLEESGGLGGKRTYKTDFEVYDQRARDPNNSQVDIHVGIE
jgi:predicted transcriptional regulator YdeE